MLVLRALTIEPYVNGTRLTRALAPLCLALLSLPYALVGWHASPSVWTSNGLALRHRFRGLDLHARRAVGRDLRHRLGQLLDLVVCAKEALAKTLGTPFATSLHGSSLCALAQQRPAFESCATQRAVDHVAWVAGARATRRRILRKC